MSYRFVLALIIWWGAVAAFFLYSTRPTYKGPMEPAEFVTAPEIADATDLRLLLNARRAILHIDVGWSNYAVQNRPLIQSLREELERNPEYHDVPFRRLELSDQDQSPLWGTILEWLDANGVGHDPLISGYGAILWIRDGKLANWVMNPGDGRIEQLWHLNSTAFH